MAFVTTVLFVRLAMHWPCLALGETGTSIHLETSADFEDHSRNTFQNRNSHGHAACVKLSYSLWMGIIVETINILGTFSWNFVDLFLILISIALANQFRQLNNRRYSIRGKAMPE